MKSGKLLYVLLLYTGMLFLSIHEWGCSKEYSYEGGDTTLIRDTTSVTDSVPIPPTENMLSCPLCHEEDSMTTGSWNFKNNTTYFCGTTTDAGFIGTTATFTFFGPSACSIDSGLVMTVYLPLPFDKDQFNITTNNVAFYYYDHNSTTDMFIRLSPLPFSLTVSSYIKSTGIATGTFEGVVYTPDADTTRITNGRFKVRLQ